MYIYIYIYSVCVYIYIQFIYTHTIEYYSDIKRNEILSFATTWMDLECIMLSEKRQKKTNTI